MYVKNQYHQSETSHRFNTQHVTTNTRKRERDRERKKDRDRDRDRDI